MRQTENVNAVKDEVRDRWIKHAVKLADPVFNNLFSMPIAQHSGKDRNKCTHLEALGRTLAGIAPYIETYHETEPEAQRLMSDACQAISLYISRLGRGGVELHRQNIIDAGYLCQGLFRAPSLAITLPNPIKDKLHDFLHALKNKYRPLANNWLIQAALIEAYLQNQWEDGDKMRIDYALKQTMQWYKGDGVYGDGPDFQFNYYNSLVIHPGLQDILTMVYGMDPYWDCLLPKVQERSKRYSMILERMISPEGTFPVVGRSATYRMGVFNALAYEAAFNPYQGVYPSQIRCALDAVLSHFEGNMFRNDGWLRIGFTDRGEENFALAESYISTGSLYAHALFLLPLGLSKESAFWSGEDKPWTQKRMWNGGVVAADKSIGDPLEQ